MSDAVTLRQATADDAALYEAMTTEFESYICGLTGDALSDDTRKPWAEIFLREACGPDPCFHCRIAEADGEAVGFYTYYVGFDADFSLRTLFLPDVFVRPGARRAGIGRALMADAAEQARARGIELIVWSVWKKNPDAMAFYESLGAKLARDEIPTYWPRAAWPAP